MGSEKKYDLLTGDEFIPKRSSQKFATRENAIKYNNLKAKERREEIKYVQEPLRKNFHFLKEELGNDKVKEFPVDYLRGAKYNFGVFTHFRTVGDISYPCIYQFMIVKINKEKLKFIRYD